MELEDIYAIYLKHPSIQTDTRKLKSGDIYVALKGERFNGNSFALEALKQGAAYAIVDEDLGSNDSRLIRVDDALTTLQSLAAHHRKQFKIPFIAITGSNGKTTTKELVHAVLSKKYKTYTTEGNLNNHIGIPLTILKIQSDAEMAIVEMGANHQQEIAEYCRYTNPTHGLITNCGKAHLEGFGGIEGVRKGKGELFDSLRATGGSIFYYKDYDYLESMSNGAMERVAYSSTTSSACRGEAMGSGAFLRVRMLDEVIPNEIQTQLIGDYNLPNVLAAISIGRYFGVEEDAITEALSEYTPSNSRSQFVQRGSNRIILDAYNANPSSMKLAVENFARMEGEHKWVALGAMMEMGEESAYEHQQLVELIGLYQWEKVILVGKDFQLYAGTNNWFPNVEKAAEWYREQNPQGIQLLLKGSRSMKMEKLLE